MNSGTKVMLLTPLAAALVGLLVGLGLNPLVTALPRWRRELPAEEGLYLRLKRRPLWLALLNAGAYALVWATPRPAVEGFLLSLYSSLLLLIAVIDLETRLIPHVLIYPAILLALLASPLDPRLTWQRAVVGGVTGFLFFALLAWLTGLLFRLIFRLTGKAAGGPASALAGFGGGDVNLAAFIGCIVGFPGVLTGLAAGILLGGVVSLLLLLTGRGPRGTFIPYGPFLCAGGWYALMVAPQL